MTTKNSITEDYLLHSIQFNGTMHLSDIMNIEQIMTKREQLKKVIDLSRIKQREDSRFYIYINRKQLTGNSYNELIEKLYAQFIKVELSTLESLFSEWMIWRRDCQTVSNKSLKENLYVWNALYKDTDITKKPLSSLKPKDFISFFRELTKDGLLTRKRFNDGKSVLNGMLYYAVENELIETNPLNDINYRIFRYKPCNDSNKTFSLEERQSILDYLANKNDIYSLGIQLHFHLVCRIGELKALKWSDISNNSIRIQAQLLEEQTMNDDLSFNPRVHNNVGHLKGNTSKGFRNIPLTPSALKILERIKAINPNGEYILMHEERQLATVTYNRYLMKYCGLLGISYKSSHKIRFTVASLLYSNGIEPTKLQELLGHTTLAMTLHYLRSIENDEKIDEKIIKILG